MSGQPLKVLDLGPRRDRIALGCVHCGLCLPACPTYLETGHEANSPRGRIQLIRGLAEGKAELTPQVQQHLDLCLDCRACESACPSEVIYHELIEGIRSELGKVTRKPPKGGRLLRWFFLNILTQPTRLKLALLPTRVLQRMGLYGLIRGTGVMRLLPGAFGKLERMLPPGPVWPATPAPRSVPRGERKMKVAYFGTCVGGVMFPEINRKAIELLTACGAEVVLPAGQGCCGAIHHHNAAEEGAMDLARRNIDALLESGAEVIVTSVAGCGAQLREYAVLLLEDPAYRDKAATFVARVRDVTEVIEQLGLPERLGEVRLRVTYHDACHLAHGQKVRSAPRRMLARVPGLVVVPLRESEVCCGAAGTYNLTEPEMANRLGERKVGHIRATGAEVAVMGNAGCALHLASMGVHVMHPVELLHAAVFGEGK